MPVSGLIAGADMTDEDKAKHERQSGEPKLGPNQQKINMEAFNAYYNTQKRDESKDPKTG